MSTKSKRQLRGTTALLDGDEEKLVKECLGRDHNG